MSETSWTKVLLAAALIVIFLFVGIPLFACSIASVYDSNVTIGNNTTSISLTPAPSPTPIIAPQQQMSYADWQKQEAARVKAEQDRKAFEESNASECYKEILDKVGKRINFAQEDYSISRGKLFYFGPDAIKMIMYYGPDSVLFGISQAKTVCTGKRNGEPFTEVQSVVQWDSAGNEIENVTFTRG